MMIKKISLIVIIILFTCCNKRPFLKSMKVKTVYKLNILSTNKKCQDNLNNVIMIYLSKKVNKSFNGVNYYKIYFGKYIDENNYLSQRNNILYLSKIEKFIVGNEIKDTILFNLPLVNFSTPSNSDSLYIYEFGYIKDRILVFDSFNIDTQIKDTLVNLSLLKPKRNKTELVSDIKQYNFHSITLSKKRGIVSFTTYNDCTDLLYFKK